MAKLPIVRDHMDVEVCSLRPETEILDAVGLLLEHRVTGAPVVDEAGRLVGMLTEKDCLKLVATGHDANRPHGTVADYMSGNRGKRNDNSDKYDKCKYFSTPMLTYKPLNPTDERNRYNYNQRPGHDIQPGDPWLLSRGAFYHLNPYKGRPLVFQFKRQIANIHYSALFLLLV